MIKYSILLSIIFLVLVGCTQDTETENENETMFRLMPADSTGIDFSNDLSYDEHFNVFTYRNYYNGGGVGIGDINNDGLNDIYFTSNQGANKLYLNKGDFQFEDITKKAGVTGNRGWSTGVTMVDINADGWLDIYVNNSGDIKGDDKQNELFINNQDGTFSEKAPEYNLADNGLSTQTAFFDYDNDGDLDAYVLNNSFRAIGSFNLKENERGTRDSTAGDKIYRNDNGIFTDVSEEAGIYGSIIGFGLGVIATDLNNDGWLDLYICNDFFERDYVYINNQDGTFREQLTQQMPSIGMASMGVDAADLDNDGYQDIFVTEMLPKEEARLKSSMTFENWNKYAFNAKHDYHYQLTRNMLQVNRGKNEEGNLFFSDMSRYAGVAATDWSWGVLLADYDLDGKKDIFITNGIYQDILNQDYLRYISNEVVMRSVISENGVNYKKLIDIIPSKPLANFMYADNVDGVYQDRTAAWGLDQPGFSNGSAYGDLDNDGDLDLVVNNVNMRSFLYKNTVIEKTGAHFLTVDLEGTLSNRKALGAKVKLYIENQCQTSEVMATRGFQSAVTPTLHFGLGKAKSIDSLVINWPDQKSSKIINPKINEKLVVRYTEVDKYIQKKVIKKEETQNFRFAKKELAVKHVENNFNDFNKDGMLFEMKSTEGPKLAVGDIDGDGYEDFYLGGARDQEGQLLLGSANGFQRKNTGVFKADARCEDSSALFFDADSDGDLDLYVCSGGNEFPSSSSALSDRLYFNNGKGDFTKAEQLLPTTAFESTSVVKAIDFDADGDLDLFVGVRLKDRNYGIPQNGYILINDGKGIFINKTASVAPDLNNIGLITDAQWADINGDQQPDLIVVGEWMAPQVFINSGGVLKKQNTKEFDEQYSGWYYSILAVDIENDGDLDFILGNHGLNSRFKASKEEPILCYINDFDKNGTVEQVLCTYNEGNSYPFALRHDLTSQLPYLNKKYLQYEDYKLQTITDIFTEQQLETAVLNKVAYLKSAVMVNDGLGNFEFRALPKEAQTAPIYAITTDDFNRDGIKDILLAGNLHEVKPEVGRYDANYGTCILGSSSGDFEFVTNQEVQLFLTGQIRDLKAIYSKAGRQYLVAKNNEAVEVLTLQQN